MWLTIVLIVIALIALSQAALIVTSYDPYSAVQGVAAEALTEGAPIYRVAVTGTLGLADANAAGKKRVIGIAANDYASGANATGWKRCTTKGHSALTVGENVYLSDTVGTYSQSLPADASQVVVVGEAKSATEVEHNIVPQAIQKQSTGNSTAILA